MQFFSLSFLLLLCCISGDVIELTDANFETEVASVYGSGGDPVVVSFASTWGGTRRSRVFEQLVELSSDTNNIKFGELDIQTNLLTTFRFNITDSPEVWLFHDGYMYKYPDKELTSVKSIKKFATTTWKDAKIVLEIPEPLSYFKGLLWTMSEAKDEANVIIGKRPHAAAVLIFMGFIGGSLLSLMLFTMFLEGTPRMNYIPVAGDVKLGGDYVLATPAPPRDSDSSSSSKKKSGPLTATEKIALRKRSAGSGAAKNNLTT